MSAHQDSAAPVAWLYRSDAGDKELILDCNGEHARRLIELGWTETPLYDRPTTLREQRDELLEALTSLLTATQPQHSLKHIFIGEAQEAASIAIAKVRP